MVSLDEYKQKIKKVLEADNPQHLLVSDFAVNDTMVDAIVKAKAFSSSANLSSPSSYSSAS